jgi:LacI family transcriptional regulator, galactose operon repressor
VLIEDRAGRTRRTKRARSSDPSVATARDVAEAAGVSTASVSRALNAPDSVRPELRDRVAQAVAELGYVRNGAGRALASLRTGVVGALVPCLADGVHDRILGALEAGLRSSGYVLAIAVAGPDDAASQARKLLSLGVEGMVSIGSANPSEVQALVERRRIPWVEIAGDSAASDRGSVGIDFSRAATTVAQYLHGIGHRRFGFLGGAPGMPALWGDRSPALQGALGALTNASLIEAPLGASGFEAAAETASRWARQPSPPTAIVCLDDLAAAGAVRGCESAGAAVPRDVSVAGFGDVEWARFARPALTTVRLPLADAGRVAADRLLALLSGQSVAHPALVARLIVRGSSGPPPAP